MNEERGNAVKAKPLRSNEIQKDNSAVNPSNVKLKMSTAVSTFRKASHLNNVEQR